VAECSIGVTPLVSIPFAFRVEFILIWWITRKSANPPYILQSAAVQILKTFNRNIAVKITPVADCTSRRGGMGNDLFARSVLTRERKVLPMTRPRRLIIKNPFQVRTLFDAYLGSSISQDFSRPLYIKQRRLVSKIEGAYRIGLSHITVT